MPAEHSTLQTSAHHGEVGHDHVAHHFDDAVQQHDAAMLGMWTFLATEVLFFGGLILAYTVYRWWAPYQFTLASHHLSIPLGAANTAVLLVSSLLVALAVRASQLGQTRQVTRLLAGAVVLGAVFLGIKGVEWHTDWKENLVPFFGNWDWHGHTVAPDVERLQQKFQSNVRASSGGEPSQLQRLRYFGHYRMFFVLYFFMTGLHAIHLVVGLGIFAVVIWLVRKKARRGVRTTTLVEVTGLYWHFIDIVWVFLYPLLYLIDPRPHL
jgi:cytochrome c oxidase subunit 3